MKIGDKIKTQYGANYKTPHWIKGIIANITKKYIFFQTKSKSGKMYILKRKTEVIFPD